MHVYMFATLSTSDGCVQEKNREKIQERIKNMIVLEIEAFSLLQMLNVRSRVGRCHTY